MNSKGSKQDVIADEMIMNRIYVLRGTKVMIDEDLALLYKVGAVRIRALLGKNTERFPEDFMFPLSLKDYQALCRQDSLSRPEMPEEFPVALTEKGLAMLAGLVKGGRSIEVNIRIIRIFALIRQVLPDDLDLSRAMAALQGNKSCRK